MASDNSRGYDVADVLANCKGVYRKFSNLTPVEQAGLEAQALALTLSEIEGAYREQRFYKLSYWLGRDDVEELRNVLAWVKYRHSWGVWVNSSGNAHAVRALRNGRVTPDVQSVLDTQPSRPQCREVGRAQAFGGCLGYQWEDNVSGIMAFCRARKGLQ